MTTLTQSFTMPEKAAEHSDGSITGRCPVCALSNGDRTGNHLLISPNDKGGWTVHCIVNDEHWREARKLLHMDGDWQPREFTAEEKREYAENKRSEEAKAQIKALNRERTARAKQRHWKAFVEKWSWDQYDRWESSIRFADGAESCPKFFLRTLFPPEAVVWTGHNWQSGMSKMTGKPLGIGRWRTVEEWEQAEPGEIGPMISPVTWPDDMPTWPVEKLSRSADPVSIPYVVLDFDGDKEWHPRDQAEIDQHVHESLAVTNWLACECHWRLAAIVHTGRKSLHCWFLNPGKEQIEWLKENREHLCGIDECLLKDLKHPARLPGQRHEKPLPWDEKDQLPHPVSMVLWLAWQNFPMTQEPTTREFSE